MHSLGRAAPGARDSADCAVSLEFLLQFARGVPDGYSTADVVRHIIRPVTAADRCRYAALLPPGALGRPQHYVCHRSAADFVKELVAVLAVSFAAAPIGSGLDPDAGYEHSAGQYGLGVSFRSGLGRRPAQAAARRASKGSVAAGAAGAAGARSTAGNVAEAVQFYPGADAAGVRSCQPQQPHGGPTGPGQGPGQPQRTPSRGNSRTGFGWGGGGGGPGGGAVSSACSSLLFPSGPLAGARPGAPPEPLLMDAVLQPLQPGLQTHGHAHALQLQPAPPPAVMSRPGDSMRRHSSRLRAGRLGGGGGGESALPVSGGDVYVGGLGSGAGGAGGAGSLRAGSLRAGSTGHGSFTTAAVGGGGVGGGGEDEAAGMGGGSSRGRSCTGFVPAATSAAISLPGAASGGDAYVPGACEGAAVQGGPRASLRFRASSATGHFEEAGIGALNPLMSRPAGPARSFGTPPPPAASSSCTSQLWGQLLQPSQPHMSLQPQPSGISRSFGRASLTLGVSVGSVGGGGNSSFTRPTGGALGAAGLPPRSPPLAPLPHSIAATAAAGACVVAAAQVSASTLRQRPNSCGSSGQGGAAGATGGGAGGGVGGLAATAGLARPKMPATGMAAVVTAAGPGNGAGVTSAANNSRPGTGSSGASSGHRQQNEELPDELDQQQQQQSQRISASSAAARAAAAIAAAATAGSGEAPIVAAHAHAPIPGASGAAAASGGAASALAAGRLVGPGTGMTNAQTVEQLQALFVGREHVLSQTRVWLDVFALNQHSAGDDTDQAGDLARLQEVLAASRSTLLVLDPAGQVLTRQWCLYELWVTARRKGPAGLQVLAAADCCGDSGLQGVWEELDVERAQAALEADRLRIMADVRSCAGGAAELNRVVKKAIVESSLHELSATRQAAPRGPAHGAAAQRAGLLLRTSGQAGEALTAAREAADVYAELLAEAEEEAADAGAEEQGEARGPGGRLAAGGDVHDWGAVAWGAGAALVQSLRLAALCHRDLGHTQQAAALLQEQVLPLLDTAPLLTTATCATGTTTAAATSSRHATARSAAAALTDLSDCLLELRRYEHAAAVLGRSLAVQLSCLAAASAAAAAAPPGGAAALAAVLHRWKPADVSGSSGGWPGGGSYSGQGAKDVAEAATKGLGAGTGTGPHGWGGGGGGLPADGLPAALLALRSLAADAAAETKQQQQQHQCHLQQEEGEEDLEVGTHEGGDEQQQPDQRRSSQHPRHPSRQQQSAASVRRASSSAAAAAADLLAGGGGRGWRRTRGEAAAVAVDVAATLHKLAVVQMARAAQLGEAGEGAALRRLARDELDTALALFDAFGDGCTGLSRYSSTSVTSVTSASSTAAAAAASSVLPPAADPVLWRRVLAARRSLAELLLEAGSPEAEGLLRSNLALADRLHGPQHPATAAALSALAACLTRQRPGTAAAGSNSFGGGAKGSRGKPGGTHGSIHGGGGGGGTAAAAAAATARRLCEAEALYRRGLDVCRQRLGEAHVDTQVVATDLGVLLADLRKYSEAEPLLLGAVAVLPYSLPPGHARSLAAHRRLAEVLEARGKLLEAASMYQMTLQLAGAAAAGGRQQPHHPHQRKGQQRGQQDEDEDGDGAAGGGGGEVGGGGGGGVGACGGGREAVDHEMLLDCRARLEAVNALLERAAAAEQGGTCCVVS